MNSQDYNRITEKIIAAAIDVHKSLGPGLLERAYRECLAQEFWLRGIEYVREKPIPVEYKGIKLECGYRLDFLISNLVVLEIKSVDSLAPIHDAQLITYLSLGGYQVGLLINFNVLLLKDGIRRRVFKFQE